jgi:predicted lipid-binding transport protein (Tim44 family)
MSKDNKSVKMLLPMLGIVFGSGIGILASILYSFHIAAGMIGGAAAGLLVGLTASILFGNGKGAKSRD